MIAHLHILAQEAAPAAPAGGGDAPAAGGGLGMFVPMILIMVMFYFILIRPQRKQQKAQEELRKNIRVGDKVVTVGGIHGLVSGMADKTVSVKVADGLSMKFDRSAVASVDPKGGKADEPNEADAEETEEEDS